MPPRAGHDVPVLVSSAEGSLGRCPAGSTAAPEASPLTGVANIGFTSTRDEHPHHDFITTWKWESMEWPNRARDTHKFNCWMRYLAVRCSRAANTASVACHGAVEVQALPNRTVGAASIYVAAAVLTKTLILTPLLRAYYLSVFHGVDGFHTVPAPSCMHRCQPTPPIPRAGAVLALGRGSMHVLLTVTP